MNLSEEQEAIMSYARGEPGNLLVRARAGTGKTFTIMKAVDVAPERNILLACFNKSIATELQSRVKSSHVKAQTLHSLGFAYVRSRANVQIDDKGERARALTMQALATMNVEGVVPRGISNLIGKLHSKARDVDPWIATDEPVEALGSMIEFATRFDLLPDEEERVWTIERVAEAAVHAMRHGRERTPMIDFADMIFLPIVNDWISSRFDMVIVDEAQDMTTAQLTIAMGARTRGGRMCVVGDDKQAIYSFRGADSGSLDRLKEELSAQEVGLTTTYRCARVIVELAREIVPDYKAAPYAIDGEIAQLHIAKALVEAKPGDFILSRKNAPLVRVCMALLKRGVPATIKGRDIGGSVMALIERLKPDDVDSLMPLAMSWAQREAKRCQKLSEEAGKARMDFVMDQIAIIEALVENADTIGDLQRACDRLFSDRGAASQVTCSSVHRAKGLEADTVYLLRETFKFGGNVEEQNLIYVAITRAKRRLVFVNGGAS